MMKQTIIAATVSFSYLDVVLAMNLIKRFPKQ